MRDHQLPSHRHFGDQDLSIKRLHDMQGLSLHASRGDIREVLVHWIILVTICTGGMLLLNFQTPAPRWQTTIPFSLSVSMLSGPAMPPLSWIGIRDFDTDPSAISGSRQINWHPVAAT